MYYRREYTKAQGSVHLKQNLCILINMKCIIPGRHTKVFGKAVHSLSRIGNALWFDPLEKGSVLPVFRSLSTLEKNVDKCTIYTNVNEGYMNFQLFYRNGITKTHQLAYEECEPLQAVFAKNTCPNVLRIQPRVLSDVVVHFPSCQEEITLSVTPLRVSFKTYCEEELEFSKSVHTEMHLGPEEFHYFQVGEDAEVTFCLKELRGFLGFAETTSSYISVHLSKAGKPVAFSMENMFFEADIILATLAESEMGKSSQKSPGIIAGSKLCTPNPGTGVSNAISLSENIDSQQIISTKHGNAEDAQQDTVEETPNHSPYNKFCTLFFGAVSSQTQENADRMFCSLATASEDEDEDLCHRRLSQTF
ncbi:hypothetical protein XENTR_v10002556 [Xenopus tropicalis]|uniref:Cell cycle checkpoint control protein RAD9A n=1 Tax=Xenopus tropicalis TaxID=8364 RepID=A0A8J1IVQ6_XENTR|nr:cell cycle checkpoint control protein RAD9B isoform X2 [Xenopus tropicalis]KAE8635233.1 hypothetical protein XENTR_v10002556 [Xenopus tropicalis]